MKEKFVQFCPKCKSTNINNDFSNPASARYGGSNKICNDCKYVSKIFPEININNLKKIKND